MKQKDTPFLSRRALLAGSASGAALPFMKGNASGEKAAETDPRARSPLSLTVNGQTHHLDLDSRTTLLDVLREHIGLTGTKKGCDHGQCGACTVHINGKTALSCLTLAHAAVGKDIKTIEGLGSHDKLHPMQEAFIRHDAFQCGYCTPGQIMSAVACIDTGSAGDRASIREFMSGNICRCAAYPNIVDAVADVRQRTES
jgi:xanthine dehydrogenase YagT iron-sulfur-binding subunit